MARYSRLKVLNTMIETGMVPVFYHPDFAVARGPELAPDVTIRSDGGAVTVTVLVSGCGPVRWTSRLVRPPAGTGTWTGPPPAAERSRWSASSDTASRLRARTSPVGRPGRGVRRMVTVFEAGEKAHLS